MEHIIKLLNKEVLNEYKFEFDGSNWHHRVYKFQLTPLKDSYQVILPQGAEVEGSGILAIKTNSELVQLILSELPYHLHVALDGGSFISKKAKEEAISKFIKDYISFDKNLELTFSQMGATAANEYTHTLLSGIEARFEIEYRDNDGQIKFLDHIINPMCISYNYLKNVIGENCSDIVKVSIVDQDNNKHPFFGVGLR